MRGQGREAQNLLKSSDCAGNVSLNNIVRARFDNTIFQAENKPFSGPMLYCGEKLGRFCAKPKPHSASGADNGAGAGGGLEGLEMTGTERDTQWDDRDFEQINKTCESHFALPLTPAPTLPSNCDYICRGHFPNVCLIKTHPQPRSHRRWQRGPSCG